MSLGRGVLGYTLFSCGWYAIVVTLAFSLLSTLTSKPIAVHCVISSSKRLTTLEHLQRKTYKCFFKEWVSTARNTIWEIGLVENHLLGWPRALQKHGKLRFWIRLCAARKTLRYRYYTLDRQACSIICINFIQFDWRTNLFLQLQSGSSESVICWCSRWISNTEQSANGVEVFGNWD